MITLRQAEALSAAPVAPAPPIGTRLLNGVLFLTILGSFMVFIEPSPYEVLTALLTFTCLLAGVPFDRKMLPLILLLLIYNFGGAFSLIPVIEDEAAVRFVAVSFFMAFTAIIFTMIFAANPLRSIQITRRAWILAGMFAATAGIVGYFNLFPGADNFTLYSRARGTFKDPNVYGPFLVLPMLFLLLSILQRGVKMRYVFALSVMAIGLFLSFSRAAWAHIVISAAVMVVMLFAASNSGWFRARLITLSVMSVIGVTAMIGGLLAVGNVGAVFKERASLNQYYDTGQSGRFANQKKSIEELLENPNGFGPLQFRHRFTNDPHQVYLNAFASYGWAGGLSYFVLVVLTLFMGFRTVFVPTPWQPYYIAVMATYTVVAAEGMVIDTDHWRHYYLLVGIIWGFAIATMNRQRREQAAPMAAYGLGRA